MSSRRAPAFVRASYPPPPFAATFVVAAEARPNRAPTSPRVAAALIDPGFFDPALLDVIEQNGLEITAVLITHDHPAHTYGLGTVVRAYGPTVYAGRGVVAGVPATTLSDGERLAVGGLQLQAIALHGDGGEVLAYRLDDILFSGPALSAGEVGSTASPEAAARQEQALRERVATLPGATRILPGHGPPTTVALEVAFNPALRPPAQPSATPRTDRAAGR